MLLFGRLLANIITSDLVKTTQQGGLVLQKCGVKLIQIMGSLHRANSERKIRKIINSVRYKRRDHFIFPEGQDNVLIFFVFSLSKK